MPIRTNDGFWVNNIKDGTDIIVSVGDGLQFKSVKTKKEKLKSLYDDYKNIEHKDMPNVYKTEEINGVGIQQLVRPGEVHTNSLYKHNKY